MHDHRACWYCGGRGFPARYYCTEEYECSCGCSWSSWSYSRNTRALTNTDKYFGSVPVDFTQPGALSSPA